MQCYSHIFLWLTATRSHCRWFVTPKCQWKWNVLRVKFRQNWTNLHANIPHNLHLLIALHACEPFEHMMYDRPQKRATFADDIFIYGQQEKKTVIIHREIQNTYGNCGVRWYRIVSTVVIWHRTHSCAVHGWKWKKKSLWHTWIYRKP